MNDSITVDDDVRKVGGITTFLAPCLQAQVGGCGGGGCGGDGCGGSGCSGG